MDNPLAFCQDSQEVARPRAALQKEKVLRSFFNMTEYAFCYYCMRSDRIIEHDGEWGRCLQCGNTYAMHICQRDYYGLSDIPIRRWLPIAEPFITKACPACGLAIELGQKLESTSNVPDWARSAGSTLVAAGVVIGGLIVLEKIINRS